MSLSGKGRKLERVILIALIVMFGRYAYIWAVSSQGPSLVEESLAAMERAPDPGPEYRFFAFGDSGAGKPAFLNVLERMREDSADFGLVLGDLSYKGAESYHLFRKNLATVPVPFVATAGNHDVESKDQRDAYLERIGPVGPYSFDFGPDHFVSLDTSTGTVDAAQRAWLDADLTAAKEHSRHLFVFTHVPPVDPSPYRDHAMEPASDGEAVEQILADHGVTLFLAGHIHAFALYERFGVSHVISGGGGESVRQGETFHYAAIDVTAEGVRVEAVRVPRTRPLIEFLSARFDFGLFSGVGSKLMLLLGSVLIARVLWRRFRRRPEPAARRASVQA